MTRRTLPVLALSSLAVLGLTGCSIAAMTDLFQGKEDVFSIAVGDCFNDDTAAVEQVESVVMPKCTEPHDNEAYHLYDLASSTFPSYDEDAILEEAEMGCFTEFEGFVGSAIDETSLYFGYYYPSPESWDEGDRQVLCLAYDTNGPISEPLRGKGPTYPYSG
ncbi:MULTISPECIES: septum formation family protein [unclassified Salinibacterium]|uniref:septum formation family protein n=1 Tax=unclassified Salinibacterium TaxID=2632331 RepID=UPI00143D2532|nr:MULTISPECIES: septum formation family protein [unclassified Salinibacterium]